MSSRSSFVALAPAFIAPLLFGLASVASKLLLSDIPPVLLAGVFYSGRALGSAPSGFFDLARPGWRERLLGAPICVAGRRDPLRRRRRTGPADAGARQDLRIGRLSAAQS